MAKRERLSLSLSMMCTTYYYKNTVSVSLPKLWAVSFYKTSYTRCAFLGILNSGDEYNDLPSISSSVTTTAGFTTNVRRRKDMGEAGVLGEVDDDGAVGWRRRRRRMPTTTRNDSSGNGSVGILHLLRPNQEKLVPILGKKTSWDANVNKREECATLGYDWVTITGWYEYYFCVFDYILYLVCNGITISNTSTSLHPQ